MQGRNGATQGFSLFELLVTLTVASILLVVGLPALGEFVARSRLVAEVNALHHVFHAGRQEAVKRRTDLVLCRSPDGLQCAGDGDWGSGWILFVDEDGNGAVAGTPAERVLRHHRPAEGVRIHTNRKRFIMRGVRRRSTNGTFLVCDPSGRAEPRALIVSYTGRPRSAPASRASASLNCGSNP